MVLTNDGIVLLAGVVDRFGIQIEIMVRDESRIEMV